MKEIISVEGNVLEQTVIECIKQIKATCNDLLVSHVIIVPDRYSVSVESMLFDILEISSTLNISVTGISRYAKEILANANLSTATLTKEQSLLLTRHAIAMSENDFCLFEKQITTGFCEQIFATISQLKANKVSAQQFEVMANDSNNSIKTKMKDIAVVYNNYQKLLNGKLDASELLNIFEKEIVSSNKVKNTNFYFVGFDSFTEQGYAILSTLCENAKTVVVGNAVSDSSQKNAYLYDNEINERLQSLQNKNIKLKKIEVKNKTTELQNFLLNNTFCLNDNANKIDDILITESANINREISHVCKQIKYWLANGKKFSDINIGCNLEIYKNTLERYFDKCNFSYYIDSTTIFCETDICKLLQKFLSIIVNFDTVNFNELIKNSYITDNRNIAEQYENFIIKNGFDEIEILSDEIKFETEDTVFQNKINQLKLLIKNTKLTEKINYFIEIMQKFIKIFNIFEKIGLQIANFEKNEDFKMQKLYMQFETITTKIFESFSIIGEQEISINEFKQLFDFISGSVQISSLPLSANSIFIADSTKGYFQEKDLLFILGAGQNQLPISVNDCGVLTDNDLENISQQKLTPTIAMINRRNRFKIFDLFLKAKNKLYISYVSISEEGKKVELANFVNMLAKNANIEIQEEKYSSMFYIDDSEDINLNKLQFNLTNISSAKQLLAEMSQNSAPYWLINSLFSAIKKQDKNFEMSIVKEKNNKQLINNASKLFFPKKRCSASQLEKYFSCPFKHFMDYGLKLKENENALIEAKEFGNILHEFAEKFCKYNIELLGKLTDEQVKKSSSYILNRISQKDSLKHIFNNKRNEKLLHIIEKEALELAININQQQSISLFKPTTNSLEVVFGQNQQFKPFYINDIEITGKIDRIDYCGNMFRIIDYKTGKIDKTFASIYYGDKVQLYIYQRAVEKSLDKVGVANLYLKVKNDFESNNEKPYMMRGHIIDDFAIVQKMDTKLSLDNPTSSYLNVQLKSSKDGSLDFYKKKDTVSKSTYTSMGEYVEKLCEKAIEEIKNGNIETSPRKDACMFCSYNGVCGFAKQLGNFERSNDKVEEGVFTDTEVNNGTI